MAQALSQIARTYRPIPQDEFDSTLTMMKDPYGFITKKCEQHQAPLFMTRIGLKKTICMVGKDASELFYDRTRFIRQGAAPEPVRATLFGKGGIQGLDGPKHRLRKDLFMSFMTPDGIDRMRELFRSSVQAFAREWVGRQEIVLYDEMQGALTRAACEWTGVPLKREEVETRTRQLTAMFDRAGAKGLGHLKARIQRRRGESWIRQLVEVHRLDKSVFREGSPSEAIALFEDDEGEWLPPRIAAVEILNLLRPTVAVAVYIDFIALALHEHSQVRPDFDDPESVENFVQEVRRFYPFFPAVVARVRHDFVWNDYAFPKGTRVMLDIYGTNHQPGVWEDPNDFRPTRFKSWDQSPYNFIPQGGGGHHRNHRCPGEWITLAIMKEATQFLGKSLSYRIPQQDLAVQTSRLPALPRSRMVLSDLHFRNG